MLISVIVTTKNEEENIGKCLEAVKNQDLKTISSLLQPLDVEIIVVDNNSSDKTKDKARQYTDLIFDLGPERSTQRNFGVEKASGKYILYLDADMILSPTVLTECVKACEEKKLIALYIPEKIIGQRIWARIRNFERSFYPATVIDCVRFVRRDKFLMVNGFDQGLTGPEDWDFDRRIRKTGKVGVIQSFIYHNEKDLTFKKYLKKKAYYLDGLAGYRQKWGYQDKIVRQQLGFFYRYLGVFFEKGKWKKLIQHPGLTLGMYFFKVSIGILWLISLIRRGKDKQKI